MEVASSICDLCIVVKSEFYRYFSPSALSILRTFQYFTTASIAKGCYERLSEQSQIRETEIVGIEVFGQSFGVSKYVLPFMMFYRGSG